MKIRDLTDVEIQLLRQDLTQGRPKVVLHPAEAVDDIPTLNRLVLDGFCRVEGTMPVSVYHLTELGEAYMETWAEVHAEELEALAERRERYVEEALF